MKWIRRILFGMNFGYLAMFLLVGVDALTPLEIKDQGLKRFLVYGLIFGVPLLLAGNGWIGESVPKKLGAVILPILVGFVGLVKGPLWISLASGAYATQTILYENGHFAAAKIEFQMRDLGALGYQSRTVEVLHLSQLFMVVHTAPSELDRGLPWIWVDKDVNELGLK